MENYALAAKDVRYICEQNVRKKFQQASPETYPRLGYFIYNSV